MSTMLDFAGWGILDWIVNSIVTFFVVLITSLVVYARWNFGTLEKMRGVGKKKVIKPHFLLGSAPNMHKTICHEKDIENFKKFGPIFGFYEGRAPHLYICDVDLIRQIFIKDFDHFHDKRQLDFGHELINEMLDILPSNKWKVVRNAITPTLTTGKIRFMSDKMLDAMKDLTDYLHKEVTSSGKVYDIKRVYASLTTDVIARCAFGLKICACQDPDNEFVRMVLKLTQEAEDVNFLMTLALCFPFVSKLAPFIPVDVLIYFRKVMADVLAERRKSNGPRQNDFVDVMNDMMANLSTPEYKQLDIRESTVMAQGLLFLFAGFETTATTLSMLSYNLAKNPDIQKKLQKEVDTILAKNNGVINHDTVNEFVYMTACIHETLRMHAPLIRLEREAIKDWYYEPLGLEIKKGVTVQVPVWAMHYNEEHYPKPHVFDPERFMPGNKEKINPYAFLAFGMGPHNCVGMRFAQEEIKLTLAYVMKDFCFELCDKTQVKFKPGRLFLPSMEPLNIRVLPRKK